MSLIILFGLATVRNITIALGSDQFFSLQHLDPFLLNWKILGQIIVGFFLPKMFSLNWTILGQIIGSSFLTNFFASSLWSNVSKVTSLYGCSVTVQRRRQSENLKLGPTNAPTAPTARDGYASKKAPVLRLIWALFSLQKLKWFLLKVSMCCGYIANKLRCYISHSLKRPW